VQEALGHEDLSTTMVYTHLVNGEVEEAMKGLRGGGEETVSEAETLAAQVLAALPQEVSDALRQQVIDAR